MTGENVITSEALARVQTDYFGQFLLDNSKFLEEIYHKLRGEVLREVPKVIDGEKVLVPEWQAIKGLTPVLNDFGLNMTMRTLNLSLTSNTATGKMDDEVLRTLAFKTYMLLLKTYAIYYDECGFQSEADMYMVSHLIFKNVLLHLSKSTDMALLKELFSSYSIHEIRGDDKIQRQEPSMTL